MLSRSSRGCAAAKKMPERADPSLIFFRIMSGGLPEQVAAATSLPF
jgi:hypothetical protein